MMNLSTTMILAALTVLSILSPAALATDDQNNLVGGGSSISSNLQRAADTTINNLRRRAAAVASSTAYHPPQEEASSVQEEEASYDATISKAQSMKRTKTHGTNGGRKLHIDFTEGMDKEEEERVTPCPCFTESDLNSSDVKICKVDRNGAQSVELMDGSYYVMNNAYCGSGTPPDYTSYTVPLQYIQCMSLWNAVWSNCYD